jgi:ParB-like chromosome segregation protein Spo0J
MSTDLKPHRLADILPAMTKQEFAALLDDIRANGLRVPIVLCEGAILDGRHRYRAAMEIKLALSDNNFVEFKPSGKDTALKFVIGQNVNRRHLNESQRAVIAANIANIEKGANRFSNKEGSIDLSTAAKMLNVGEATVKRAKTFLEKAAPELVEKVKQGTMRVSVLTNEELKKPHEEQLKIVQASGDPDLTQQVDDLIKRLIKKLKELKQKNKDHAQTDVANLIRDLKTADLM